MTPIEAWDACLQAERIADPSARACGEALMARWEEPHRHYHSLTHLAACMDLWSAVRDRLHAPSLAGLALLYHDAIYDPEYRGNEAASAGLCLADLVALGVDEERAVQVGSLILATDHRTACRHPDAPAVIDIDLAILGADPAAYAAYAADVRREYAHVDEAAWRTGRARVLASFLGRPRLFTSGLLDRLEAPARRNLAAELADLGGH